LLTSGAALLCGANDQIGEIVAEPRWRLATITAAWRLAPAASLRRGQRPGAGRIIAALEEIHNRCQERRA
jgi:hypothetical protein